MTDIRVSSKSIQLEHGGSTQSVGVADCYFIVNVRRFTVCLTYSAISLTMYINQ